MKLVKRILVLSSFLLCFACTLLPPATGAAWCIAWCLLVFVILLRFDR